MADPVEGDELPQALVVAPKRSRFSIVWIIPILAALVAIGIAVQRIRSEGPTITIIFRAAEGIEAGKTLIKYKDVNIGLVTAVQLTEDYTKVEVTAKIAKRAAGLMVRDAKFWIVSPTISLSGISGLSTLLSGNYIGFEAGTSDTEEREFVGLDVAPFVVNRPGARFVLNAADLGSLGVGSPIYYRRLPVGQVTSYELEANGKAVEIKVFVNAPFDRFVSPSTRFWNASGVDITLDADGFNVRTESVVALLVGGLAFDAPPFARDTTRAAPDTVFKLYSDRASAMKAPDAISRHYVLHFNESLRGLSIGAPVTLLGLPVGEVTDVGLDFDVAAGNVRPRVTITLFPERLFAYADAKQASELTEMQKKNQSKNRGGVLLRRLIEERGLRAQLRSGSLLTGQLYVALEYFPNAAKVKVNMDPEVPELPVVSSTIVELEAKLGSILDKIDRLPIEAIGKGVKKDLESLDATLIDAKKLINNVDTELVPTLKTDLESVQRTLATAERAIANADSTLLAPNAPAQQELRDALTEFTRAARSLRVLLDYLERHPESPIRGKKEATSGGK